MVATTNGLTQQIVCDIHGRALPIKCSCREKAGNRCRVGNVTLLQDIRTTGLSEGNYGVRVSGYF